MLGGWQGGGNNSGMDLHPVQGLVIKHPVASCEETKINQSSGPGQTTFQIQMGPNYLLV